MFRVNVLISMDFCKRCCIGKNYDFSILQQIELAAVKKEELPKGWGADSRGKVIIFAKIVFRYLLELNPILDYPYHS